MSLEIKLRWKGSCPRHPRYNPQKDGEARIKAGCEICKTLLSVWDLYEDFLGALADNEAKLVGKNGRIPFGVPGRIHQQQMARADRAAAKAAGR